MFKNLKLGVKIGLGFACLIAIALVLGGLAIYNMKQVTRQASILAQEKVPAARVANNVERAALLAMYHLRGYAFTSEPQYLTDGRKELIEAARFLEEAATLAEKSETLGALATAAPKAAKATADYLSLLDQTVVKTEEVERNQKVMDEEGAKFMKTAGDFLADQMQSMKTDVATNTSGTLLLERLEKIALVSDLREAGDACVLATQQALSERDPKIIQAAQAHFETIKQKIEALRPITRQARNIQQIDDAQKAADAYQAAMNALLTAWVAREDLMKLRITAGETVTQGSKEITLLEMDEVTTIGTDAEKALSSASSIMLVGLIVALVVGCVVALVITRSITGPLNRAIAAMTAGSQEVASAAGQISTASQNLAEGATEQASSLEESSSALEELASQAGGNAEKAKRATDGAETAQKAAEQASEAMHETVTAMNEIKESSNRISGIIKTIEEIAFQTNLLALNAAVEAARAGEHGKGFAVVAEEVRNLAQRSAVAAKDTATLIQTSVEQSNRGAEVVGKASEAIVRILDVASQVARDAREVKTASEEQSEGIHQINNAVAEMDKVTQQVASNAEETASASEELSAQSQQMQAIVGDLVRLVGGARGNGYSNGNGHRPLRLEVSTAAPSRLPDRKTSPRLGHSVASASSRKAAAAIPFDRDEQNMADF